MVGQTNEKGISSSMYKVLRMCEENKIQSVSFPALGTGKLVHSEIQMSKAKQRYLNDAKMLNDSPKHLKRVHIVIFQAKLLPDFQEAVKKSGLVKPLQKPVIPVPTQRPAICLCISKDVQSSHITDLPETDKKAIVALSRANQISVLVTSSDKLTVSGKRDDVLDAVLKINGFIQAARDRETREGEVKRLRETLCWEVARGERWESLESGISYDIELAFHRKQKSCQYQEKGETYTVDFDKMEVTNSICGYRLIAETVPSVTFLVCFSAIIHPPTTWTKMDGRDLEIITLQSNSAEYKNIETAFLKSSQHPNVKPIDRIQSQSQWQRYCVLKQAVDKKYPKQTNERLLYHGTTKEICQKINKNGFNRSFCGRNAVVHGEGTYFGKEAWYSCQDQYSNPDDKQLKYIYRARVVTGSLCKSRGGMKEPDPINAADPRAGLHDCAVDSLQNPFIFVVFCDAGAYPEYLITFKSI
uniref:Poly [ADP-ribose] polymerase n=1 Tax=Cyprinus carpio TaxID=7962 RepID=A0A8C1V569_CYPCA